MSKRIENLILKTLAKEPNDYWHLLVACGAHHLLFIKALKNLLSSALVVHQDQLYSLSPEGKKRAFDHPLLTPEALIQLKKIASKRPARKDELDQALAPLEVILDRLALLHEEGDLIGTRIILLGDDDCMGVALALTGMPKEVIILEYDEELCAHYERFQIPHLTIHNHDLCHPLPEDVKGTCDVFFTDPCPSLTLFKLFLSRGLETLKGEGCVGYTAMSQTEATLKKWHTLQKLLIDAGCTITEIRRHINTYNLEGEWLLHSGWNIVEEAPFPPPLPTIHWYCSSLMRLETVHTPTPFFTGSIDWDPTLYKDEEVILTLHNPG